MKNSITFSQIIPTNGPIQSNPFSILVLSRDKIHTHIRIKYTHDLTDPMVHTIVRFA